MKAAIGVVLVMDDKVKAANGSVFRELSSG